MKTWILILGCAAVLGAASSCRTRTGAFPERAEVSAADHARALLSAGDFYGALDAVQAGLETDPEDIELRVIRGVLNTARWTVYQEGGITAFKDIAWAASRHYDATEEQNQENGLSDRILSSPKRPRYARAAELALQQSNPREFPGARQEFLALVRKEPDDPFPRWLLAHIDQMYGDDKEAVAQYEILISKTAAPVGWLHEGKARALLASGRIEAAVTEARLAVKHQESAASLRLLNRALLRAGRVEESIEPMARLVSNDHFGIRDWNHNYLFRPLIPLMSRDPKDRERYMDAVWGASLEQPLEQLRKGALFQRLGHGDIALRAYQAASRSENSRLRAQALFGIGDILFYGAPGVRQDRVAAIPHLQEAANLGDPDAMLMLGYALQNGLEVEKDFSRAAALFEEAHRRGSFVAASNLGNLVKNGQGTEKDPARALYLYRKAMRFGFADAFNNAAYFMATTPEFWDADRAKAWSEYAVSRETNGAWLNTLYSVYKRAEEWDKAETAWRRWEKWWRSSGNHGQEMPERWARRRDLLDEKLKTFVSKPPPQPPMADSDADVPEKTAPAIEVGDTPAQIAPLLLEFRDREQPTDAQKRWALATMAIYQEISELDHDSIAGGKLTRDRMDGDQYDLAKDHQAFARRDFLQHLRLMAEQGTGSDFDCLRSDVISLDSETWVSMMKNLNADIERLMMIEMIRENKQTLGDSGLLAWNLLLRVSWCRRAYRAGYLSEDEFWRHVMPVARLLQKSFDSWETMGRNYLHGFQYSAPKDFYTTDTGRLRWLIFDRLLRDADSPWLQLPWDLDLSPPSANDEIEPID